VKIKVVGVNARFTHSCLALFYVRNALQAHLPAAAVTLHQFTINDPYYSVVQGLLAERVDYFFISAVIWNSDLVEQLIRDLLIADDTASIVVGGPQAAIVGEQFTKEDRVCVFAGEIEAAPAGFFEDLHGAVLKKVYRASFLRDKMAELSAPYQAGDFEAELKNRYIYYESSRGCPFSCTYCLSSSEKGLYHKSLDRVFAELDEILLYHPKSVRFVDRTFNDLPERALQIWENLAGRDCQTTFHFEIAPDRFTPAMFALLETVRPGLFEFEIGIQSTNGATLEEIRRPMDIASAHENIRRLRSMETIHLHADLILGLPCDTRESFAGSVNDVFRMKPHYIQMGLLKLLPETQIRNNSEAYGYRASSRPPYPVFANSWMDGMTLRRLYWVGECLERLYNNRYFIRFWNYLVSQDEDMAAFFEQASERFHDKNFFVRATTQEHLARLLVDQIGNRPDSDLLRELLCYDWLRCGHRYLPDYLDNSGTGLNETRRELYHVLPQVVDGLYDRRNRAHFIKKSVFRHFTGETLIQAGHQGIIGDSVACFTPEREPYVHRLNETVIIELNN
jgi:hypothetical protein